MSRPDPARRAAYDVLKAVRVESAYANLALPGALARRGVSGRDAAFATELASGAIRWQGLYDEVLGACLDRPLGKVQAKVVDGLRLGCHQLLSMRVPAHAAISTTVDLVRSEVGPGASGFANAVLRKVSEHDRDGWVRRVAPDPGAEPLGFLTTAYSHPRWMVEALGEALAAGGDPAELEALLDAHNQPPAVTLVARPGRSSVDELPGDRTRFSPYGVVSPGGAPADVVAVAEGRAGVQDEGSQLVAHALVAAPLDGRDERWLDVCAGPGGKAALLAALAGPRGARIVANEMQPHRAELVRRSLAGADGVEAVSVEDGTAPPWPARSFDRVLVDAPCTGLGALRRRPEARWRRRPEDLADLVPLQRALLDRALDLVRPGGVVLYATCSPVLAETRDVVGSVLVRRDDVKLGDTRALLTAKTGLRADVPDCDGPLAGTARLWPHRHRTDAMFLALLRRAGA
ncbi:MAG TPA: transcription antitermination factor NusB [Nocardioides sp.]|uniref:RsmB/NOP family class I SAM-dependent RNA methyltransferase n=1 Tax=Nocardioides sp. TaxID=35761 RepID=UPI002F415314